MQNRLVKLAHNLGEHLKAQNLMLATAESCTGGWVSEVITSIPGSSMWFERGFVTYNDIAKQEMLGVSSDTLDDHGAVSEETVRQMAEGALTHSHAQISVAITLLTMMYRSLVLRCARCISLLTSSRPWSQSPNQSKCAITTTSSRRM